MKTKYKYLVLLGALVIFFQNCSGGTPLGGGSGSTSSSSVSDSGPAAAGSGVTTPGVGALSVPTEAAIVVRLQNGLQNNVSSTAGNFAKSLAAIKNNLPKVTDPTKAVGFDQVQLLAYAACSDLTTGTTPLMMSKYNVNPKTAISANQAALVAAGVLMLDQYTASLASQGPTSAQVSAAFTTLVQTIAATSTNTTTMAFIAVCTAANATGATMLGF